MEPGRHDHCGEPMCRPLSPTGHCWPGVSALILDCFGGPGLLFERPVDRPADQSHSIRCEPVLLLGRQLVPRCWSTPRRCARETRPYRLALSPGQLRHRCVALSWLVTPCWVDVARARRVRRAVPGGCSVVRLPSFATVLDPPHRRETSTGICCRCKPRLAPAGGRAHALARGCVPGRPHET